MLTGSSRGASAPLSKTFPLSLIRSEAVKAAEIGSKNFVFLENVKENVAKIHEKSTKKRLKMGRKGG